MLHNDRKICCIVIRKGFFFVVTASPVVQLVASLLGSLREKFSLLSAVQGSRVLVCGGAASLLGTQSGPS